MIHVKRWPDVPDAFRSERINQDREKLEKFYSRATEHRKQEKFSEKIYGDTRETVRAVADQFNNKCSACERKLSEKEIVVDSWRPRQNARGFKEVAAEHYWWLSYQWENKYCLCARCNNYKSTWFPVDGKRSEVNTPYEQIITQENALLVDPCIDYPEEHFWFEEKTGLLKVLTKKGEATIELLKLNRQELIVKRRKITELVAKDTAELGKIIRGGEVVRKKFANKVLEILRNLEDALSDNPTCEYAFTWRSVVLRSIEKNKILQRPDTLMKAFEKIMKPKDLDAMQGMLRTFNSLRNAEMSTDRCFKPQLYLIRGTPKRTVTRTKKSSKGVVDTVAETTHERLYLERIQIRNFKSIGSLSFEFKVPGGTLNNLGETVPATKEPWKFILGENGVGKSSILQAIALVLCGQKYLTQLKLDPSDLLKHGAKSGYVKIFFVGGKEPAHLTITRSSIKCNFKTGSINILGYGGIRVLPKAGTSLQPEESRIPVKIKNLFDYSVSLADANKWLNKIDEAFFDNVAKVLKQILNLPVFETFFYKANGKIYFSRHQETLDQLCEGHKAAIALAVDIMKSLSDYYVEYRKAGILNNYEVVEGIVLVDEISSHLHPSWQMKIVKALRTAFPKLVFVVTSHDPLSLKGVENGEVLVLRKDVNGEIFCLTNLPDPSAMRAEQLLTSEFFGLNSTLDPELETEFNTYHFLLAKGTLTEAEQQQLGDLRKKLDGKQQLGTGLRDTMMYKIIDQSIADYQYNATTGPDNREGLMQDTQKKVLEAWDKLYKS